MEGSQFFSVQGDVNLPTSLSPGDYVIEQGANPSILHAHYTPMQNSYHATSQQHWSQPRRVSASSPAYIFPEYPGEPSFNYEATYSAYPDAASTELHLAPSYGFQNVSPHTTPPHHLTPPTSPGGSQGHHSLTASPSSDMRSPLPSSGFTQPQPEMDEPQEQTHPLYTQRDQLQLFKDALSLPSAGVSGPFVPQLMYQPHTNSDRRHVEEVNMEAPIQFWVENPTECGISLSDALHSRVKRLLKRNDTVFEGRGPSVTIRIEWPGYRPWNRTIPTKDFRSPPGPITRAKLTKNLAKCIQKFIEERQGQRMEDDADPRWKVGSGPKHIKLEDLVLVSLHHVSTGSWQPHLRLVRSL